MKSIELKIEFGSHNVGDVVEMENNIAKHFLAKGWAVEKEKPKKVKK